MTPPRPARSTVVHGRDRGAAIPLIALLLPVLIIMTAFAVDLGRQRSVRRDMQAAADVISLDMARLADGRTLAQIEAGDATRPAAATALAESAARNDLDPSQLTLDWGTWDDATGYLSVNGDPAAVPEAARIIATETIDYFFQPGTGEATREAIGQYGLSPIAAFSVGSYGATLDSNQSAFLSKYVTPALGGPVGLDAASYEALAGADFQLGDLAPHLGAGTPQELLENDVYMDDVMLASAEVLRNQDPPKAAEAQILEDSITTEMGQIQFKMGDVVSAESGTEDSAMDATLDPLDVLQAGASVAKCGRDPNGYEDCQAVAVPTIDTTLPLLTSTGTMQLVQSPRYGYGPVGTSVKTGQVQATMNTIVGAQNVGQCQPTLSNAFCTLNSVGLVTQVDARVTVDATITMAGGLTKIMDIGCADPAALELLLQSDMDLYDIDLVVKVDFARRGVLGGAIGSIIGTMTFTGSTSEPGTIDDVLFTVAPDVLGQTMKSTGNGDVGLAPIALNASGTAVLTTLGQMNINYTMTNVLNLLVNPIIQELDQDVLQPLASSMGLNVSGSDLMAHIIDCGYHEVELVG
jgi:uncharacterized membrane protein